MILVDATFINTGGGRTLLRELLIALRGVPNVELIRDSRLPAPEVDGFPAVAVVSGERDRRAFYARRGPDFERVLCLGNVPPPVRLAAEVGVYFHNMNFLRPLRDGGLVPFAKMSYIAWRASNADFFMVQSGLVQAALAARMPARTRVFVAPFFPEHRPPPDALDAGRWSRFAYVSDASAHKNHVRLLDAWRLLADRGVFPELHLTVYGPHPKVIAMIACARQAGVRVTNHGYARSADLYGACGYQVYPSLVESFGLGLVEAAESGCAVIASDLPYVREVIEPSGSFDPLSHVSIADSVAGFVGRPATASAVRVKNRLADIVAWLRHGTMERFS